MVALGLVLFALAAVVTGGVLFSDSTTIDLTAFGTTFRAVPLGVLFLVGLLTGLVGLVGLGMMSRGAARRRALRRQRQLDRREARDLQKTNEQLTAELARERERNARHGEPYPTEEPLAGDGHGRRHARP